MNIHPTTISASASGGFYTVDTVQLTKLSETRFSFWSIASNQTWITIAQIFDSGGAEIGEGASDKVSEISLNVSILANTGGARTGDIIITVNSPTEGTETGRITINQAAGAAAASISVSPTSKTFTGSGGTVSLTYTTTGSGTLSVSSNQSWATVSGSGNTRTVTVAENSGVIRYATITGSYGGKTATTSITQNAFEGVEVSPSTKSISYAGGSFTVTATCSNDVNGTNYWSVSPSSGVSISATTNSHHTYTGTVTVAANSGSARNLSVNFTHGSGATGKLTITQKGISRTTMTGDNKLATRADFNSQMRGGYYGSDTSKVITGYEIKGLSWSDSSYDYVIELNNSGNYTSSNGRCVICSDVVRVNKAK